MCLYFQMWLLTTDGISHNMQLTLGGPTPAQPTSALTERFFLYFRATIGQRFRNTCEQKYESSVQETHFTVFWGANEVPCRSQWPRDLRRGSAATCFLGLWIWILPGAWMFVSCGCSVLSGRGLCVELITRPEESYRVWCVLLSFIMNPR
jgi:hypothetical protein